MNFPDWQWFSLAAVISVLCCYLLGQLRRQRLSMMRVRQDLDSKLAECRVAYTDKIELLEKRLGDTQESLRNQEQALAPGLLNRPCRARALQMLHSGQSPENTAASLDLPRNEIRLLAKISRTLIAK